MRRWLPFATVLAGTLFAFVAYWGLTGVGWSGGKKLPVEVLVIDTDSLHAVAGAEVTIFGGPQSPLEGRVSGYEQSAFLPDPDSKDVETRVTDSELRCTFNYRFFASGSDDVFRHTGSVVTSGVWLRIVASDRPSTLVPLDRQSVRPRDIHDEMPIVVTVVLNKCPME